MSISSTGLYGSVTYTRTCVCVFCVRERVIEREKNVVHLCG